MDRTEAHVATVGERVSKGDVLFEIYSPELVTSQWDYISAIEYADRLRDSAVPTTTPCAKPSPLRLRPASVCGPGT